MEKPDKINSFEDLLVWQKAIDLSVLVYQISAKFPREEMFSLTSQFKRTSDSISLNIAEGSIGQSDPEQKKFVGYAIRSLAECVNCLYLSIRRKNINQDEFNQLYKRAETLFAKMNKFKGSLGG